MYPAGMSTSTPDSAHTALVAALRQKQVVVVTSCPVDAGRTLAETLTAAGRAVTTWEPGKPVHAAEGEVLLVPALERLEDGDAEQGPLLVRVMDWIPTVIGLACSAEELAGATEAGVFRHAGAAKIRMDLYHRLLFPPPVPFTEMATVLPGVFGADPAR